MAGNLISSLTQEAINGARNGDADCIARLKKRFADLEALKKKRGLQCCAISQAEYKAIQEFFNNAT